MDNNRSLVDLPYQPTQPQPPATDNKYNSVLSLTEFGVV